MSDPILYLIDKDQAWEHWVRNTFEFLEECGVVALVEPCEHGNIDEHLCTVNGEHWQVIFPPGEHLTMCPGAVIGGKR